MARLRRSEQVEHNRAAVLDAARRVFLARGYGGASLEAIAEEAGFSRGVVYSQFGSKADMFLALLDRRIDERATQNELIATQYAGVRGLKRLIQVAEDDAAAEPGWVYLLIEFRVVALRDPELNRRYADAHQRTVAGIAAVVKQLYAHGEERPPVPVRSIAEYLQALAVGTALERAVSPEALPTRDAVQLLLGALQL
jgi:AcrR family transcriptional regulator